MHSNVFWPLVVAVLVRTALLLGGLCLDDAQQCAQHFNLSFQENPPPDSLAAVLSPLASRQMQYTDVDYQVFTDAAEFVASDRSPYERATYRYPSSLAWTLSLPAQVHRVLARWVSERGPRLGGESPAAAAPVRTRELWLWMAQAGARAAGAIHDSGIFGKVLFCLADIGVMLELYRLLTLMLRGQRTAINGSDGGKRVESDWALRCCWLWAVNVPASVIATRGSFDSVSNWLLLYLLRAVLSLPLESPLGVECAARCLATGTLFGSLVHLRLFPSIYTPAFALYLLRPQHHSYAAVATDVDEQGQRAASFKGTTRRHFQPLLCFGLGAVLAYAAWMGACWSSYGDQCLTEAVLYHATRTDHRHNFSPRFLEVYLFDARTHTRSEAAGTERWWSLLCTCTGALPQLIALCGMALRYAQQSLPLALLLQTMLFVVLNRVCTAQYFTWFLCLLPLALPGYIRSSNGGTGRGKLLLSVALAWCVCVATWLAAAYRLEFQNSELLRECDSDVHGAGGGSGNVSLRWVWAASLLCQITGTAATVVTALLCG